jgi:hypothetical protein
MPRLIICQPYNLHDTPSHYKATMFGPLETHRLEHSMQVIQDGQLPAASLVQPQSSLQASICKMH